jgi:hypothetical protein
MRESVSSVDVEKTVAANCGEQVGGVRSGAKPKVRVMPTTEIVGEIPRFDQREQQHSRAAVGALGEKIQKAWTADSVDPFRRIFYPNSRPYNSPLRSLMAIAEGPVNPVAAPVKDPAKMAAHIKEVAKFFGAHLVGVCELQPWMVYSHRGLRIDARKGTWGQPIELNHRFAMCCPAATIASLVRRE